MRRMSLHLTVAGAMGGAFPLRLPGRKRGGFFGMYGRMRCEWGSLLQPLHFFLSSLSFFTFLAI